jgi:hypothetical protein
MISADDATIQLSSMYGNTYRLHQESGDRLLLQGTQALMRPISGPGPARTSRYVHFWDHRLGLDGLAAFLKTLIEAGDRTPQGAVVINGWQGESEAFETAARRSTTGVGVFVLTLAS